MSERLVASGIACAAAIAALCVGVVLGAHVAGGSDSSCYLNSARLLSEGSVGFDDPLARSAPWPHADQTFTPAGFTPSSADRLLLVPICSPGLSLTMALFRRVHLSPFLVVPLLGALAVWLTFVIGRAVDRPATGAAAAVLMTCSPTFLYQLVQPMSDVPATGWWLMAVSCIVGRREPRWSGWAGLAASAAILTRPNLAPLAVVLAGYLAFVAEGALVRRLALFGAGLIPGALALAVLQRAMYGSPLATGYGSVGGLMSVDHVMPNLFRYTTWLFGAHTPLLLLAFAAPFVARGSRSVWLLLALAVTTLACYLPYTVFDDWWYTRFLLPAIPALILLSVMVAETIIRRATRRRLIVAAACVAALALLWLNIAKDRRAFDLAQLEQHYYRAGLAARRVAGPAAIVTLKDSGSVRYHAQLATLSWDILEPSGMDEALAFVRSHGYTPYLLLELDEEPVFRERFASGSVVGRLDWPPRIQIGRTIRLYDPDDRRRFLEDGVVRTTFVPEPPPPSRDWRRWLTP
jgi:hypothetical protein